MERERDLRVVLVREDAEDDGGEEDEEREGDLGGARGGGREGWRRGSGVLHCGGGAVGWWVVVGCWLMAACERCEDVGLRASLTAGLVVMASR